MLPSDWLSRLFEIMPVRGRLDLRCFYGAPWRIDQGPGEVGEIPYHAVVGGSAVLEDPAGGRPAERRRHSAASRKSAARAP
jgi:AraC family transcriptional regulator, activator of mtrCDE